MDVYEVIDQVAALLQKRGRVTYRSLQYQFKLDDEGLEVLKEELIDAQELATDKDGKMLVWTGDGLSSTPQTDSTQPQSQSPSTYTTQHLAERIRAEQAAMESRGSAHTRCCPNRFGSTTSVWWSSMSSTVSVWRSGRRLSRSRPRRTPCRIFW